MIANHWLPYWAQRPHRLGLYLQFFLYRATLVDYEIK